MTERIHVTMNVDLFVEDEKAMRDAAFQRLREAWSAEDAFPYDSAGDIPLGQVIHSLLADALPAELTGCRRSQLEVESDSDGSDGLDDSDSSSDNGGEQDDGERDAPAAGADDESGTNKTTADKDDDTGATDDESGTNETTADKDDDTGATDDDHRGQKDS